MAKRKKKKSNLKTIVTLLAFLFGLGSIVSLFLPIVSFTDTEVVYTGLEVAFGKSESVLSGILSTQVLNFSILSAVNYGLVVVGILFLLFGFVGKGSKIATLVSFLAFVGSTVMFFMHVEFVMPSLVNELEGNALQEALKIYRGSLTLGIGAIIAGGASAVSALCCGVKLVIK